MNRREIEDRLRRVSWPAPSAGLRAKVLSTAVVTTQPIAWSDRVWFSRQWRFAAMAAALMIVVLDLLSTAPRPSASRTAPQALAEAQVIEEIGRQAGLPEELAGSLARRTLFAASRTRASKQAALELLPEFTAAGEGHQR